MTEAPIDDPAVAQRRAAEAAVEVLVSGRGGVGLLGGGGLASALAAVPDPRSRRGVRYLLATILGLSVSAVLSGRVTLAEITDWVSHADQAVLARWGCRRDPRTLWCIPPHPDTVERLFAKLGAQHLADHLGVALARRAGVAPASFPISAPVLQMAIAVDGKAMRGAVGPDGQVPYLLAAATHGKSVVIAERAIGPKTNEVPELLPLLRGLAAQVPLTGCVITVDAGLTSRDIATGIVAEIGAHYVMTIKANQPTLYAQLCAVDFDSLPVAAESLDTGHGRRERRTIKVVDAPEHIRALYPFVAQVFLIDRHVVRKVRQRRKGSRRYTTRLVTTHIAAVGITSMTAREAGPEHLAAYVRGHWAIENKIHWVRDVTFREDASQIKTGSRPRIMATLRNLAIGLIRQAGFTKIADTIRKIRNSPPLLLTILDGLIGPSHAP